MYRAGVRYGSDEGQIFAAQVMEFVRYHAMLSSIKLAEERSPFPAIKGSRYDPDNLTWKIPESVVTEKNNWNRPKLDWQLINDGIKKHGIRNAAQTTVAPTGTIATVSGCEGYGCEPVFALAYTRRVIESDGDLDLIYTSPLFEQALEELDLSPELKEEIINSTIESGTCQDLSSLPENIRNTFVVSSDISAEAHVRVQAALQAFVEIE